MIPTEDMMKRRNFIKFCALGTSGISSGTPFVSGDATVHGEYVEPARRMPVAGEADVIVCGGGPAGSAAAIAAGRRGAKTILLELKGSLGGAWTVGLVNCILDRSGKKGMLAEIYDELKKRDGVYNDCIDPEKTKLLLEELCSAAGVRIRYHTRVVGAHRDEGNRLKMVITESKAGREAWAAKAFIDATGDGDLAALAGCGYDIGHPENGKVQPMSMLGFFSGIGHLDQPPFTLKGRSEKVTWMYREIMRGGFTTSYSDPTFYAVRDNLSVLMANHEYNINALDPDAVTQATLRARREMHEIVKALRSLGGRWKDVSLVATPEQIGIRESRRIHGRYMLRLGDVTGGARFDDAVCRAAFSVDVHSIDPEINTGIAEHGYVTKPYDIPLRALIAKDIDGLMMAGRNISGDFYAHASYRVTGNSVPLGEAAGMVSARAALTGRLPHEVPWQEAQS